MAVTLLACSACKESKPKSEFTPRPSVPRGAMAQCRPCSADRSRAYKASRPWTWRWTAFSKFIGLTSPRFWDQVTEVPSGCWIWRGSATSTHYGTYNNTTAHRFAYEEMVGEVPEGLQLDHLCRVVNCVNPYHLDPVTPAENCRRSSRWHKATQG